MSRATCWFSLATESSRSSIKASASPPLAFSILRSLSPGTNNHDLSIILASPKHLDQLPPPSGWLLLHERRTRAVGHFFAALVMAVVLEHHEPCIRPRFRFTQFLHHRLA